MSTAAKNKKMSLTLRIVIALALGLITGLAVHYCLPEGTFRDTVLANGIFQFIGQGFVRLLQFLVVPLVLFSISAGTMAMSDTAKLGRVAIKTLIMYFLTTAIAIIIALILATSINPGKGVDMSKALDGAVNIAKESPTLIDTLLNIIPKNPFASLANGEMLQVIVIACIIGYVISKAPEDMKLFAEVIEKGNKFMMILTGFLMELAPYGVFALIARTFAQLGLSVVGPLLKFLGTCIGAMGIHIVLVYILLIAVVMGHISPAKLIRKVLPVYTFAFSSASSNATIPLTLKACDTLGISPEVSSFTIPLGATINMDGTAIYQGVAVVFIANAYGMSLSTGELITVVLTAVLASIGTAGVPGSGMIMLSMVLASIGLPVEGIALIASVERIVDMFRTALNVTGDVVVTTVCAKTEGMFNQAVYDSDMTAKM